MTDSKKCIHWMFIKEEPSLKVSFFRHVSAKKSKILLIDFYIDEKKRTLNLGTSLGLISRQNINPKPNAKTVISERRKTYSIVL